MARRDIGNAEFIDHDTESGIPKGAGKVTGVRNWTLRLGETDKDTRKSGRSPVTMLPARLAIVNVYQLADKIKVGGKKDKAKKGKKGNQTNKAPDQMPLAVRYGYGLVAVSEEDGVALNENGYPATLPQEDKSTYNKRVFGWLNKTGRMNKNTQTKFGKKSEEQAGKDSTGEAVNDEAKNLREMRDRNDANVRAENAKQPRWILWEIVKANKIKTEPTVSKYENDEVNYSRRDPTADFDKIKRAIANAKKDGRLITKAGQPPNIVAIQPTMLQPPTAFYIKNDISESRKRKLMHSKVKRPLKASVKKHPVSHGNKRRVVMKKKGGKR
jgi:hypothetical protein